MKAEPLEKKISRRTSESKHYSASQGFFLSSKAPLGYRKWTTDDPREWDSRVLIVEPKASQAVKESFEQGKSSLQDLNSSYTNIIKANNIKKSTSNDILKSATNILRKGVDDYAYYHDRKEHRPHERIKKSGDQEAHQT